jgi:hypothetical protein
MPRSWTRFRTLFHGALVALLLLTIPSAAAAQGPGVRGGVSIDPDQFYFGGHYETDALVDRLHFRPNVEVGIGDDLTAVALNFEFAYKFPSRGSWRAYAGGGPAINFYTWDDDGRGGDDSETEPGLNFLFGVESRQGLFFEFKVGVIDSPELKFGVGWTFR